MATVVRRFDDDDFDVSYDAREGERNSRGDYYIEDDDTDANYGSSRNKPQYVKSAKPKASGRNWSLDDSNEKSPSPPRIVNNFSSYKSSGDAWVSAGPGGSSKGTGSTVRSFDSFSESKHEHSPRRSPKRSSRETPERTSKRITSFGKRVTDSPEDVTDENIENCHRSTDRDKPNAERIELNRNLKKKSHHSNHEGFVSNVDYHAKKGHKKKSSSYDSKDSEYNENTLKAEDYREDSKYTKCEEDYEAAWNQYTYTDKTRRSGRYLEAKTSDNQGEMSKKEKAVLDNKQIPFILVAHQGWTGHDHVRCAIERDRSTFSNKMYPSYKLILECTGEVILIAKKMQMNATSNYHLFDMTRGSAEKELTKKSCNYIGKLRAQNKDRTHYVLVTNTVEREEVAGMTFQRQGVLQHLKEGAQPRKLRMVCPPLDSNKLPIPLETKGGNSILDEMGPNNSGSNSGYRFFHSKEPVYENGSYRLNFHGRVTQASVKNFQLVDENDIHDIICQFGKIGEDKFTLDYKYPLNGMQAFCIALCQFNL